MKMEESEMKINQYPKGWKFLALHYQDKWKPEGWRQWRNYLWGFDIWFDRVPMMKLILLLNLVAWTIMWIFKQ